MLTRIRQTFITSDLHFGHPNICRFCNRPYAMQAPNRNPANAPLLKQMEEDILQMFDKLPADCDIWNLGDIFFFTGKPSEAPIEDYRRIVARMKGVAKGRRLFLVKGNHDGLYTSIYRALGFTEVYDTPVILEDKWILSHEPVWIEPGSHFVNLYGHTHDLVIPEDYFCYDQENYAKDVRSGIVPEMKWPERKTDLKNYTNVCLDHWHGIPQWKGDTLYVDEQHKIW